MGWFDSEQSGERQPSTPARPPQRAPAPPPSPAPPAEGGGSTLGKEVHIDGTIVCGEDLTILGKVEGTIHAKGTLVIAKEADVRATIDGQRVMVHGKVEGNVHGAEKVVLGATAELNGNIDAPALEIVEGAYFKGDVEMPKKGTPKAAPAKKEKEEVAEASGEQARLPSEQDAADEAAEAAKRETPAAKQTDSSSGEGKSISA